MKPFIESSKRDSLPEYDYLVQRTTMIPSQQVANGLFTCDNLLSAKERCKFLQQTETEPHFFNKRIRVTAAVVERMQNFLLSVEEQQNDFQESEPNHFDAMKKSLVGRSIKNLDDLDYDYNEIRQNIESNVSKVKFDLNCLPTIETKIDNTTTTPQNSNETSNVSSYIEKNVWCPSRICSSEVSLHRDCLHSTGEIVEAYVMVVYLSGSGVLWFQDNITKSIYEVNIVPGRAVIWSNPRYLHGVRHIKQPNSNVNIDISSSTLEPLSSLYDCSHVRQMLGPMTLNTINNSSGHHLVGCGNEKDGNQHEKMKSKKSSEKMVGKHHNSGTSGKHHTSDSKHPQNLSQKKSSKKLKEKKSELDMKPNKSTKGKSRASSKSSIVAIIEDWDDLKQVETVDSDDDLNSPKKKRHGPWSPGFEQNVCSEAFYLTDTYWEMVHMSKMKKLLHDAHIPDSIIEDFTKQLAKIPPAEAKGYQKWCSFMFDDISIYQRESDWKASMDLLIINFRERMAAKGLYFHVHDNRRALNGYVCRKALVVTRCKPLTVSQQDGEDEKVFRGQISCNDVNRIPNEYIRAYYPLLAASTCEDGDAYFSVQKVAELLIRATNKYNKHFAKMSSSKKGISKIDQSQKDTSVIQQTKEEFIESLQQIAERFEVTGVDIVVEPVGFQQSSDLKEITVKDYIIHFGVNVEKIENCPYFPWGPPPPERRKTYSALNHPLNNDHLPVNEHQSTKEIVSQKRAEASAANDLPYWYLPVLNPELDYPKFFYAQVPPLWKPGTKIVAFDPFCNRNAIMSVPRGGKGGDMLQVQLIYYEGCI